MKLHDAVSAVLGTKWAMTNTFGIAITPPAAISGLFSGLEDVLNVALVDLKTPDFRNPGISAFIANEWRIHSSRDELYTISFVFRDYDQFTLYKKFKSLYDFSKNQFFDDACFSVAVYKDPDWTDEISVKLLDLDKCLITGISNLDFSNDAEARVAKFTVEATCIKPNLY